MLELKYPRLEDDRNEKYYSCVNCGVSYQRVHLKFDSGSVEPQDDEVLTGATSGATGVVEKVTLLSGSWAGGDAAGWVTLSSPTGVDWQTGTSYSDDELVNGSVGGANILTADGAGQRKRYGRLYPESMIVERDGRRYCRPCYIWKFRKQDLSDFDLVVEERSDRETEE